MNKSPAVQQWKSRAGFSLVEVTLALMVVAVGILSVMSLFPAGLDQNMRSIADTRAAFFAEEVFSGLQACAQEDWSGLDNAIFKPIPHDYWKSSASGESLDTDLQLRWTDIATNCYVYHGTDIEKYALRFSFDINTSNNIKQVTLFVWNGEFGTTNNPSVFYSEFHKALADYP